jgi:hypothetical protein
MLNPTVRMRMHKEVQTEGNILIVVGVRLILEDRSVQLGARTERYYKLA